MKKVVSLLIMISLLLFACPAFSEQPPYEQFVYGTSEQGRDLVCCKVGTGESGKSLLMIFELHGYEDKYDRDGQVLTDIAYEILDHYAADTPSFTLYVVPSANPDGLIAGKSKNGFGRCNANGIDINRDFPVGWTRKTTARYKTGKAPFASAEAAAIRDLVGLIAPTYGADVHGWLGCIYGTKSMAAPFIEAFGFSWYADGAGGKCSMWLETVCEAAVLIELPDNIRDEGYVASAAAGLIQAIDAFMTAE